jgi:hypothetical protein
MIIRVSLQNLIHETVNRAIIYPSINLSQSGQREPLFVGLSQKDGFEGQMLRKRVSHA